mgnify:CR=1 FL=1
MLLIASFCAIKNENKKHTVWENPITVRVFLLVVTAYGGGLPARQIIKDRPCGGKDPLPVQKVPAVKQYDRFKEAISSRQPMKIHPSHNY